MRKSTVFCFVENLHIWSQNRCKWCPPTNAAQGRFSKKSGLFARSAPIQVVVGRDRGEISESRGMADTSNLS
jgi:hypothetical protein